MVCRLNAPPLTFPSLHLAYRAEAALIDRVSVFTFKNADRPPVESASIDSKDAGHSDKSRVRLLLVRGRLAQAVHLRIDGLDLECTASP